MLPRFWMFPMRMNGTQPAPNIDHVLGATGTMPQLGKRLKTMGKETVVFGQG
jgi:hypothetical protein